MRDRDPEFRTRADVLRLADYKFKLGSEVYTRYQTLKGQGRDDTEARNVAVAWTAGRFPQYSQAVIRRALEDAINPPSIKQVRAGLTKSHWSLPT